MPVQTASFKTPQELQTQLGANLRALRLNRNVTQQQVAGRAGVALKSVRNLELGSGSSVETLVRVLKALDAADVIETLVPAPRVSPLALLKTGAAAPQRARPSRPRGRASR